MNSQLQAILDRLSTIDARVEPIAIRSSESSDMETMAYAIHNLVIALGDLTREIAKKG